LAVRPVQFTGDTVQPADHRSIRVETAAVVKVERTHLPWRRSVSFGRLHGTANRFRLLYYGKLSLPVQGAEAFRQMKKLEMGVMMKQRQAAVVFTSVAREAVMVGGVFVRPVH
jgi:hypothetical protein